MKGGVRGTRWRSLARRVLGFSLSFTLTYGSFVGEILLDWLVLGGVAECTCSRAEVAKTLGSQIQGFCLLPLYDCSAHVFGDDGALGTSLQLVIRGPVPPHRRYACLSCLLFLLVQVG
jgi:hypothetical protein